MKITKTKVLTVLLIIAVVIIAILCVKLLSKEDNNPVNQPEDVVVNNEQIEEKKEESVVEEKVVKGEKLFQFDTEFYNLEDVALEWRDSEAVKNYKDFNYDLDGDGVVDKVTMKKNEYDEVVLSINNEVVATNLYQPYVYIVDLNEDDKNIEVVAVEQHHLEINSIIYDKVNGKIEPHYIDERLKTNKKGIILNSNFYSVVEPSVYPDYIFIKDGKLEKKFIENTDVLKNIEFKTDYSLVFSTDFENFNRFKESQIPIGVEAVQKSLEEHNIEFMSENMSFKILDLSSRYVQLQDGRKGYIDDILPWIAS